jgi:hypothetical protein
MAAEINMQIVDLTREEEETQEEAAKEEIQEIIRNKNEKEEETEEDKEFCEFLLEEAKNLMNIISSDVISFPIISIDPGFDHMAILSAEVSFNSKLKTVSVLPLRSTDTPCCKPKDCIELMTLCVRQFVHEWVLDPWMCKNNVPHILIEKGFFNYGYSPNNPYAFVPKVNMQRLENCLYTVLACEVPARGIEFIPASSVKRYYNIAQRKHRRNKMAGMQLAKYFINERFQNNPEILTSWIFKNSSKKNNNAFDDNHCADAFNQMVYWIEQVIRFDFENSQNLKQWKWSVQQQNNI